MQDVSKAFLQAYDQYAEAIYRHCYFRVNSKERAEEFMQETFLKTWQYAQGGIVIDNIRALLYRIAENMITDYYRKKKDESLDDYLEAAPQKEPADHTTLSPNDQALISEIKRSMQNLPEDARKILTLRYIDDLDPKEIAEILNISSNNVSVKVSRAIEVLKQQIDL